MTNAEKFKEDFGFENDDTNTCPYKDCIDKDSEKYDSCDECIEAYWRSEYKGTPTIPLSVIEKIKAEIHKEITSGGKWSGGWYEVTEENAIKKFDEIIDKAVKEIKHERS